MQNKVTESFLIKSSSTFHVHATKILVIIYSDLKK